MNQHSSIFFIRWFALVIIITLLCGLGYALIQQDIRIGGYDPQIQISEDIANALSGGGNTQSIIQTIIAGTISIPVDPSKSLSTFVIIYDDSGKVTVSTGLLNGVTPVLPAGVLDYVKAHNEDRITWQPQSGVRLATVINRYSGTTQSGYILVGRSMREIESRNENLLKITLTVWAICIFISLLALFAPIFWRRA
jgi:hypothetical protein